MIDMKPNRSALSTDVYVLKGEGLETFFPRFRGQGMRFAEITGWPGIPAKEDLKFLVVHTDLEKAGEFACSNELVNKIYANMLRTVRMQERGMPMDPDRDERQAWLSVSEKTSETESYMYHVGAFYTSFLGECRIDQREDGCLSDAGSYWSHQYYSGDPCWPAVVTTTPWSCFLMYGDRRIVAENYPMMKRWVEFLAARLDADYIYRKGSSAIGSTPTAWTRKARGTSGRRRVRCCGRPTSTTTADSSRTSRTSGALRRGDSPAGHRREDRSRF